MSSPAHKRQLLFQTASNQFGLFTAKQAEAAGYSRKRFNYQLNVGEWQQEGRGLFKLTNYLHEPEADYMQWLLWSRSRNEEIQGCLSHETAMFIYELGDVMPSKIHITVPRDFRRSAIPKAIKIHYANLPSNVIYQERGLKVTSPIRTFLDLLAEGKSDPDIIKTGIRNALDIGLITKKQISEYETLSGLNFPS